MVLRPVRAAGWEDDNGCLSAPKISLSELETSGSAVSVSSTEPSIYNWKYFELSADEMNTESLVSDHPSAAVHSIGNTTWKSKVQRLKEDE